MKYTQDYSTVAYLTYKHFSLLSVTFWFRLYHTFPASLTKGVATRNIAN